MTSRIDPRYAHIVEAALKAEAAYNKAKHKRRDELLSIMEDAAINVAERDTTVVSSTEDSTAVVDPFQSAYDRLLKATGPRMPHWSTVPNTYLSPPTPPPPAPTPQSESRGLQSAKRKIAALEKSVAELHTMMAGLLKIVMEGQAATPPPSNSDIDLAVQRAALLSQIRGKALERTVRNATVKTYTRPGRSILSA